MKGAPKRRGCCHEFLSCSLGPDITLHLNPRDDVKTARVDVLVGERLARGRNTRLALASLLLDRGTRRLPDMQQISRFADELYGADFSVSVDRYGDHQALHVALETVDARFLPWHEELQLRGMEFLHDVLCDPVVEGHGFPVAVVEQEKATLAASIASQRNDKLAEAQRHCVEAMCPGQAYSLPRLGDPADLVDITADELFDFYLDVLRTDRIDVYMSGRLDPAVWIPRWSGFFDWPRAARGACPSGAPSPGTSSPRMICETKDVAQGWLVLGYRTPVGGSESEYAALQVVNQLWGAGSQSRLFRTVREMAGWCYHVDSSLDPLWGILLVSAGIDQKDYEAVVARVGAELAALADGRISPAELDGARALLLNSLLRLSEDPAALVGFDYPHRLVASGHTRDSIDAALRQVDVAAVAAAAGAVHLDAGYFVCPGNTAAEGDD